MREYRADERARLKVLAPIALMLACGVLEVVINDLPGWVAAILIGVLTTVDGVWAGPDVGDALAEACCWRVSGGSTMRPVVVVVDVPYRDRG
ncbi:hypothetical protein [Streptomyces sp. NPDC007991]|uniref:hypothetical protein n=1 Tax=Streptomyces sp. NPDC007991 TaxID=3364803 RepID=UPI0036E3C3EF